MFVLQNTLNYIRARHYFVSRLEKKNLRWTQITDKYVKKKVEPFILGGNYEVHPEGSSEYYQPNSSCESGYYSIVE